MVEEDPETKKARIALAKHQDNIRPRKWIFDSRGSIRYNWDIFIIFLALYHSVVTPLDFSFDYIQERVNQTPLWQIEIFVEVCYYIDIYVGFTTSYINNYTGEAYYGPYKIAKYYVLHGSFFLDFLSTFRFEYVIKTTD